MGIKFYLMKDIIKLFCYVYGINSLDSSVKFGNLFFLVID